MSDSLKVFHTISKIFKIITKIISLILLQFQFIQKLKSILLNRIIMKNKPQDLIVCNHYRLVRKLGTGAFGQIYLAENKKNADDKYAAKLQDANSKYPQLQFEAKIYKYLHSSGNVIGIPKVHAVSTEGEYNIMLMDLLGSSIEEIFVNNSQIMSLKSSLMVGYQMVERVRTLHEKQIIHRDIKPDNFLFGTGNNASLLHIVDFGLSKKYIKDNEHIPYKEGKELTGTARYASINTHMGIQQSRRDDIQSVAYVIMYLLRGVLPWQNMLAKDTKTKYRLIMEKKKSTPPEVLCKGFPHQLAKFIEYARNLKFEQQPNYEYLLDLLKTAMKNKNIQMDYIYDWTKKEKRQLESEYSYTQVVNISAYKPRSKKEKDIDDQGTKIKVPLTQKTQTLSNLNANCFKPKAPGKHEERRGIQSNMAPMNR